MSSVVDLTAPVTIVDVKPDPDGSGEIIISWDVRKFSTNSVDYFSIDYYLDTFDQEKSNKKSRQVSLHRIEMKFNL